SEQVQHFGAILQPGRSVILNVEADERPDGVSLRLLSATPLEEAAQKAGKRLTIFAEDARCLESIHAQLKPGGEGQVVFIVARDNGAKEYEIELRDRFQLTPALAGGIKSLGGVVDVRLN